MKKTSKIIDDSMMTIEEFGNLLNLEEELDKVSTTPSDDEIKQERSKMRTLNTISWLEAKYIEKNQKYFKKIGKIYTDNKKIKLHFKHLYEKNHNDFKKTNYAHYVSWLKNNNKI